MDLVEQLRIDPENGARRLEVEYKAGLLALARRLCADEGDAEELVNCTFAEVVRSIDRYAEQSAFFGWMARIMIHLNGRKKDRKSNETVVASEVMPDVAADPDADARLLREVDASILRDVIEGLPADIRKTLLLHYFMDMPVKDVARFLALPVGTVTWRLHYARQMLAAKLGTQKPGVKLLVFALLLSAGLAVGGALYTLGAAAFGSRAESAEVVSHAENAESAESVFHAENAESAEIVSHAEDAESAEPTSSTFSTPLPSSTLSPSSTSSTVSTPESSEMNAKPLLAATSLALAATSASAATDHWTYTPPASGTQGTISWTDSSGFENIVKGAVLSGGQITFVHSKNASSTTLRNLDLSLPVYAEDGVTQYEFSPYALGRSDLGGRIVSGSGVTNIVLHPGCKSLGRYCFKGCTELVKVTLNDGLEEICEDAFREDKVLAEIVNFFPDSLKSIGIRAFDSCTALSGTAVANGLETMENRAFIYCNALQGFDCGRSSLAKVDTSTFYKDTALETVVLPDTVTDISSGAFYQCTSLTNFTPLLPPALQALGTPSNNDRPLYDCPILGHVVSPHTLTNLLSNSFRGTHIESFTSPRKGLRSIGEYAFSRCPNLTNVVLSADLESISANWLYNVASTGEAHVWFRNLPANLPGNLWANTTKQHITIHLPWSQQDTWREWVASGPSGHTFTFNKATRTLPEHLNDVGTWQAGVTQNVTWWKDAEKPTLVLIK